MAFKTFYSITWICLVLFTVVQGSCLEYGHSCWGAHGKRSGNTKIFHTETKPQGEVDFSDLNAIKEAINEKNTYDSTEEQLTGPTDNLSSKHDLTKDTNDDILGSSEKSTNFKKLFYQQLSKNGKRHSLEPPDFMQQKSNNLPMISERWRRLPLYNVRRLQMSNPETEWLRELEREPQQNEDYI